MTLNTSDTLLAIALPFESDPEVERLGFEPVYTGVGKVNAAYNLMKALNNRAKQGKPVRQVLNFGSAGSKILPRHSLALCNKFVQRDMNATALGFAFGQTPYDDTAIYIEHPPLFSAFTHYTCGSGDNFETGKPMIPCEVIDMEAFALAKVCLHEKVNFASLKFITDGADEQAAGDWKENLRHASTAFVQFMQKVMK